jgi:pyruvate/2-oxoglutarate dehydrogenase complex dihydrolipoamide dehydrogenase (E3) component
VRADISRDDSARRFRDELGVDVFLGDAAFTGPDSIAVAGVELRFKKAVIASGARADVPPVPGLREADPLTNETVFNLVDRPRRLIVIGGGPIGCELAQAMRRFGCEVTLIDREARLLPKESADAAAKLAVQNALFFGRKKLSSLVMPWCTYTDPEVAHVGLTEAEARERSIATDTFTIPLEKVNRAACDGETDGFVRVHTAKGSDRILGATIVASHAGEMIGEVALAITSGLGLAKIAAVVHPYPTQAEGIKAAANAYMRTKLTPTAKKFLGLLLRIQR